jgi:hypothetical protein
VPLCPPQTPHAARKRTRAAKHKTVNTFLTISFAELKVLDYASVKKNPSAFAN